jgi:hypothetical protein
VGYIAEDTEYLWVGLAVCLRGGRGIKKGRGEHTFMDTILAVRVL